MPKGYSKRNQGGWKHSNKSKGLMSNNRSGLTTNENNPRWQGDLVSYPALHSWVRKHYHKPKACEKCGVNPGVDTLGRNKLHWANKTKKYLRDRKDWLALCVSCHRKLDLKNNVRHRFEQRK